MSNTLNLFAKKAVPDVDSPAVVSPDTPNVLEEMIQLEQVKTRAKVGNELVVKTEKEKDAAEKAGEELKQ